MKRPIELEHRGLKIAGYRHSILERYLRQISRHPEHTRARALRNVLGHVNRRGNGRKNLLIGGHLCRSTFFNWLKRYREHGFNGLTPRFRGYDGVPRVSDIEGRYLARFLNDGVRIGTAILILKYVFEEKGISIRHSPATLRRWAERLFRREKKHRQAA